mgnify:CR=1 FL=1
MPDYSKGKIYRLVCNITGVEYIGHTVQPLSVRKAKHVNAYKRYTGGQHHYITSYKVMEHGDFDILLIEDYSCDNIEQLKARERYWIEKTSERVNKHIPCRTFAEWQQVHKERLSDYQKQYRQDNKEHLSEYANQSVQCGCGSVTSNRNKSRHERCRKHQDWLKSTSA